jgi:hypothetical protein
MYESYANIEDYKNYGNSVIPDNELMQQLKTASRHIDSLTYNRIVGRGFDNLTEFQKDIVKEVVCRQAEFEYENKEELESIFSSYAINGVSMTIQSGWNIYTDKGIAMMHNTYSLLEQTGLCDRLLR